MRLYIYSIATLPTLERLLVGKGILSSRYARSFLQSRSQYAWEYHCLVLYHTHSCRNVTFRRDAKIVRGTDDTLISSLHTIGEKMLAFSDREIALLTQRIPHRGNRRPRRLQKSESTNPLFQFALRSIYSAVIPP